MINRVATTILTLLFLGVMFGGLFHISSGMSMDGNTSGCPFMLHSETLCSMNVLDHVGEWKSVFLGMMPTLTLLLSALVSVLVVLSVAPNLLQRRKYRVLVVLKDSTERVYWFPYHPLQELFSSGILHPKLF